MTPFTSYCGSSSIFIKLRLGSIFCLNYEKNLSLGGNMYMDIEKNEGRGVGWEKRINTLALKEMKCLLNHACQCKSDRRYVLFYLSLAMNPLMTESSYILLGFSGLKCISQSFVE